ncbi:UNVERIFIED_CONTAM: hypothetical protein H355_001192 [Colinus virginianus]|nr:hypothetical protein H355_001192 [Colinus virginianus]
MVRCGGALLRRYGNFIDDLRLYVKGGTGGMGYPRLGGEGGRGGDVWLVARESLTLKSIKARYPQKRFVAGTGANSSVKALKGEKGEDCEVHVPPGISILDDDGKKIGKNCCMVLMFPNAGKSSLLSKISKAKPEIANYACKFTLLFFSAVIFHESKNVYNKEQEIMTGIVQNDFCLLGIFCLKLLSAQILVADLPGLIEGAHRNKGRGHKFLKHVERTKHLLLVVDVSGFQLSNNTQFRTAFETILLLTKPNGDEAAGLSFAGKYLRHVHLSFKELELYNEELLTKPALLAINKMDLPCAKDNLNELMKQLQNSEDFLHLLEEEVIPKNTIDFRDIIPISTYTGEGIDELKASVRRSLDEEAEQENEEYQKKKLLLLHTSGGQLNKG